MSLLEIKSLNVDIHGTPVLQGVSLSVDAGRITGVIGQSGSGKSMTALSVMQLLPHGAQCAGQVRLNGRDVLSLDEPELCQLRGNEVGMVFQEPMTALNPLHTIGAQVAETIQIHEQVSRADAVQRAAVALERVELPVHRFPLSRYPHELSGGQRQRVGIAMAIARHPKLLIADEPTTALDVTTQAEVLDLLRRLVREDNMGLLMISHDLGVVSDMADEIVIMRHGAVVETGPFGTLRSPYARALLAASDHMPNRATGPGQVPLAKLRDVVRDYVTPRKGWLGKPGLFRAVDGVSFDIIEGENLGLVGESGCGKSTLTRALLGLEPVQGGTIDIMGHRIAAGEVVPRHVRAQMQVVFQDPYGSFNPRHTVARLVAEPFHLSEAPPQGEMRRAAVVEALESVGLQDTDADKYIHEFSGGQRQRIAIARALIIRPKLIVLDEAVSALDVQVRAQILDLLAGLSDKLGLTYLFISHDLSVVRNVCDRVMVMQAGQIVETGTPEQVFAHPQHDYTKALIAAVPHLPDMAQG
ncbi:MAG: ABC transporter ATP-binding protein [Roseovarius sp.]